MTPNPALRRLGFADDDRVAIIHTDDIGMCQASVTAFAGYRAFEYKGDATQDYWGPLFGAAFRQRWLVGPEEDERECGSGERHTSRLEPRRGDRTPVTHIRHEVDTKPSHSRACRRAETASAWHRAAGDLWQLSWASLRRCAPTSVRWRKGRPRRTIGA